MSIKKWIVISLVLVAALSTMGASSCDQTKDSSSRLEMAQTETNQKRLVKANPPPQFKNSQERQNLIKKLERWNVADKISYIYLVDYGKVMAFYTVKGKVSSLNSMLTTPQQIIDDPYGGIDSGGRIVSSPDFDGSYGANPDGIFFFTTEDVYVEWMGNYMLADQPLKLSTPPQMVRQIN